jgi:glycosyltransferase involved in cell wall biosynthesis
VFPVDDSKIPERFQKSNQLMDFLKESEPAIIAVYLLNRQMNLEIFTEEKLKAAKILHVNTYHIKGTTFNYLSENPKKIDLIIANAPSLRDMIENTYPSLREKLALLPSAVQLDLFFPEKSALKKWDLVWTGMLRNDDDKRVEEIIDIAKDTKLELLIIGDGTRRKELEEKIARTGSDKQITIHPWVHYSKLPELLNRSKIYITTALMDPSSRSISEALACGLPIVGYNRCLGTELQIYDGINGFRCNNTEEFRTNLLKLLEDKNLYDSFSLNSRKIAVKNFNWDDRQNKLFQLFNQILNKQF